MPNYLDKFGRNFLVASMIPSLAFFLATMISLQPTLPDWIKDLLGGEFELFGKSGFFLLVLTIILGFTLTSLNTFIYKVFEGYVLIWRLPFLRSSQVKRARQLKRLQKNLQIKIARLENCTSKRAETKRNNLIAILNTLMAEYELAYPPSEDDILPTKFGNILKSAESYSRTRYHIDGVPMWPRLISVIPGDYYSKVDDVSNQLSFLMNCTVLAISYSLIILSVSVYHLAKSITSQTYAFEKVGGYLILSILAILVGIVFLRATVLVVGEFGYLIRSSYDLFRRKLLIKLDLGLPLTLDGERDIWEDWCDFVNLGFKDGQTKINFQPASATISDQSSLQNKIENDDS